MRGKPGPRGDRGVPGAVGPRGVPGMEGPAGKPGTGGKPGAHGLGNTLGFPEIEASTKLPRRIRILLLTVEGAMGVPGDQGLPGRPGAVGPPGKAVRMKSSFAKLLWTCRGNSRMDNGANFS